MTTANTEKRRKKSTSVLHTSMKLGLWAGIAGGTILGVPPFVAATESILGGQITLFGDILSATPLLANLLKGGLLGSMAMGSWGIWSSRLPTVHKVVGLAGCGIVVVNVLNVPSVGLAQLMIGSLIPLIGSVVWGCCNAAQIHLLTLNNDESALKQLLSKMSSKPREEEVGEDSQSIKNQIVRNLGRNKVAESVAFWFGAATLGYVMEFLINIFFGSASTVNWLQVLQPGGLVRLFWQIITQLIVLAFTIGSIEFCVLALQHLDEMSEAIKN